MLADGILRQTVGCLNKGLDSTDLSAYLIHARTEDRTLHLHRILITVQGGVNADGVLVHQLEVVQVKLTHIEYGVHLSGLTMDADCFRIGITGETASIAE